MTVFERIKELADEQGKSLNRVEEELGLSKNVLYRMKSSDNPTKERLEILADYFGVTVDYLLGRTKERYPVKGELTNLDLDEILDNVKSFGGKPMTDRDRETLRAYLEGKFSDK